MLILTCGVKVFGATCWNLVWADEFNGTSINTANWGYDTGCNAFGNNEWENYTNSPTNSYVTGGHLVLNAVQTGTGQCGYTSARLTTHNKVHFTYGRIEASIKMPYGQGIWPAFWMLGENINATPWPACGELDVVEMIGGGSGKDNVCYGTAHWADSGGAHTMSGSSTSMTWPAKLSDSYHVYAIEWDAAQLRWYFDGVQYYSVNTNGASMEEFTGRDFYILFNLAVGGTWPGYPDGTTVLPQQMMVDYVRWYQQGTCPLTPTFTPTFTRTATPASTTTRTRTPTPSASSTHSRTPTFTITITNTPVNTKTYTPTFTRTATPTFTITNTQAVTYTFTAIPTFTRTASPASTSTGTSSPSATASSTNTPINTATNTSVNTSTPSITFSVTSSMVPTSTSSVVPGATFTLTRTNTAITIPTDTPQRTATGTPSNTETFTRTITPAYSSTATASVSPQNTPTTPPVNTSTRTNTASITPTNTSQDTATNTPVSTVTNTFVNTQTTSPTSTFTATSSNTAANTATYTGINTQTVTSTATPACTVTNTITPFNTPAPTDTAVSTPTTAATPDKFEIKDLVVYPNPYNKSQPVYLSFDATQACGSAALKIYTASFRMILKEELGACEGGRVIKPVPAYYFSGLANGAYYYVITAKNYMGKSAVSKIQKLIILR